MGHLERQNSIQRCSGSYAMIIPLLLPIITTPDDKKKFWLPYPVNPGIRLCENSHGLHFALAVEALCAVLHRLTITPESVLIFTNGTSRTKRECRRILLLHMANEINGRFPLKLSHLGAKEFHHFAHYISIRRTKQFSANIFIRLWGKPNRPHHQGMTLQLLATVGIEPTLAPSTIQPRIKGIEPYG